MSNTERPVIEWLRTIADPIVRESAIRQCIRPNQITTSLAMAISRAFVWDRSNEGRQYWVDFRDKAILFELEDTISPSATDWMQEVHQMD